RFGPERGRLALLFQLVRLSRQRGERGLEEIVGGRGSERPRQEAAETRRDDLRRSERGGGPGAGAAAASHELSDRLLHAASDGLLIIAPRAPSHGRTGRGGSS